MKRLITFILIVVCPLISFSQVGIGTASPSPSSILELKSSSKGFLIPRMSATERTTHLHPTLTAADVGLMIFQTTAPRGIFIYQGFVGNQHKWNCLPTAPDGTDVNGATLRWDGNAWINTLNLFKQGNLIGLNTTNPRSNLHIHGLGTTTQIQITDWETTQGDTDGLVLGLNYLSGSAFLNHRENKPILFSTNNTERLRIDSVGRVGINKTNPEAKLDVNGNFKLGPNGAVLTNILRNAVVVDIPMTDSMSSVAVTVPYPNAMESATVYLSPATPMNDIMIAYSRVSTAGTIEIKFMNMSSEGYDPPPITFYVTVIQ